MILKNKVIVFLGNTRFDSPIKATSLFIARNLAKDNTVFFIDYPFTLKDYFSSSKDQLKERKEQFSLLSDGLLDSDLPNFKIVITPPVVPINFLPEGPIFRAMLKVNEAIIATRIKKILTKKGITDFIFINSFNFHYPTIARLIKPTLTVYQCVDPMIIPYDMKHGIISESILVNESDLVICTSKALYEEKKPFNKHTYFVPNATDSEHISKILEGSDVHDKLKGLPRPIVGYLGTIERRINYALVEQVVLANPEKTFIFAGPVLDNYVPEKLYNIANLHIIGAVPYEEVPQVINSFDIAIIPFKRDIVSNTIFPIKLFEYLSAGKPVIMTDFNTDLKEFTGNQVEYCHDATSFTSALNDSLANNSPEKVKDRIALAKQNTWEKRSDRISEIIHSHLEPVSRLVEKALT
jgi:teichuronic acid biosynthesis glycosyltransferase TuaH